MKITCCSSLSTVTDYGQVKDLLRSLKKKATLGWTTLYYCNICGVYWEVYYPEGEYHGGGAPALRRISDQDAFDKYGV